MHAYITPSQASALFEQSFPGQHVTCPASLLAGPDTDPTLASFLAGVPESAVVIVTRVGEIDEDGGFWATVEVL